jgi:Ca2+-binding RTX toxin-like protein
MLDTLESLESRRLFTVTLTDGVLTVTGTENADQLVVGRNETMIVVNDNGTASQWNPADVNSIAINGLGGDDQIGVRPGLVKPISIDAGAGNDAVHGGTGRERILGGEGNDLLDGGGGGDLLNGGAGDDVIVGGAGEDQMTGGAGNDRFDSVDRNVDLLDGGDGEDYARISVGDHAMNIEHVQVRPPLSGVEDGGIWPTESSVIADLLA